MWWAIIDHFWKNWVNTFAYTYSVICIGHVLPQCSPSIYDRVIVRIFSGICPHFVNTYSAQLRGCRIPPNLHCAICTLPVIFWKKLSFNIHVGSEKRKAVCCRTGTRAREDFGFDFIRSFRIWDFLKKSTVSCYPVTTYAFQKRPTNVVKHFTTVETTANAHSSLKPTSQQRSQSARISLTMGGAISSQRSFTDTLYRNLFWLSTTVLFDGGNVFAFVQVLYRRYFDTNIRQKVTYEVGEIVDHENSKIVGRNRRPAHAFLRSLKSTDECLRYWSDNDRLESALENIFYLTGEPGKPINDQSWKFRLVGSPKESPAGWELPDFKAESASSSKKPTGSWDSIALPGHWQLQGYDTPLYTNTVYPFAFDPPRYHSSIMSIIIGCINLLLNFRPNCSLLELGRAIMNV